MDAAAAGLAPGTIVDCAPYVAHGDPVLDCCRQLAVNITGVAPQPLQRGSGGMAADSRRGGVLLVVTFQVTVTTCFPLEPDGGDFTEAVADAASRAWGAYNNVSNLLAAGSLFPGFCRYASAGELVPIPISGGCGGYRFSVRAQIDGFDVQ